MHLDEELTQRFLDGELAPPADQAVAAHLAGCAECRARVDHARRERAEVHALVGRLDHALPRIDAAMVADRAAAPHLSRWKWAAGIALVLGGAGAAWAVPGSPVRGWLDALVTGATTPAPAPGAQDAPAPPQVRDSAGIAIAAGPDLVVEFVSARVGRYADVSLVEGGGSVPAAEPDRPPWVRVRAIGGVATFTLAVDRIVIDGQDAGATFEILIPRDSPRVEIRVGGRSLFLKDGSRITTEAAAGPDGVYRLELARGPA